MLTLDNVSTGYDAADVLHGVSITARPGELTVVLGANGSGKTTLFKTISGLMRVRTGSITYEGRPLHRARANAIVKAGIAHCPEGTCSGRCRWRRICVWGHILTGTVLEPKRSTLTCSICGSS
ncbi:ATP-binding cassette domain-containing protein [Brevibacterium linens]|uniref:ATP-binding cassette domain-containing protein n=1 Tax=Brevibacterium linens TaxID=1703 RepID=UPI000FCC321B|nr:ATP-binding cassette domain-containing protein [Brevibacterium linens]AZU01097.1 hypothetical protein CXR29_10600 [Brevibacterium linens]